MARFRGTVAGYSTTQASRLGSEKSGIAVEANGWDSGVKVFGSKDDADRDVFQVVQTGGSNARTTEREVLRIVDGEVFVYCGNFSVPLNDLIRFGARPAVEARAAYDREHS